MTLVLTYKDLDAVIQSIKDSKAVTEEYGPGGQEDVDHLRYLDFLQRRFETEQELIESGGQTEDEPKCDCGHAGTPDDKHLHTCAFGRWLLVREVNEKIRKAADASDPAEALRQLRELVER